MRLQTPEKIRTLQRKLYLKAKAEPDFGFYLLYDKVYREDILFHAYRLARSNEGAPGVDGQSFEEIEAMGLEGWLSGIRDDLRAKTYRPEPVRRAMVPKPGGGERPLGIPTIRDRVVQGAVKLVIEPILDPSRKSGGALHRLHCFCLEFDGACEVQRRVPTDWIIEPIDVSGYGSFSLAS